MKYRIEYAGKRCCNIACNRNDLIEKLKLLKDEVVVDIRKVYKSGVSDSVMEIYEQYFHHGSKLYQDEVINFFRKGGAVSQ